MNWSAYEDIAEFFTGRTIDGKKVYGHMDYGKKDPSLGWRFTDAWLSMAGNGDKGEPNGLPVDEWGIRVDEKSRPVGSCVARGGDTNGPAAVYAIAKYLEWLKKYAPPAAQGMTFSESGPVPSQGEIAQQMFWYTTFTADMVKEGLPVMNADGTPKWRMAPSPHGAYWEAGPEARLPGRRLVDADEVDADRPRQGRLALRPVRHLEDGRPEEVAHRPHLHPRKHDPGQTFTERAPKLGGLVEFYRSPARVQWSPTGTNVPDYPKLAQLWWQNIGDAAAGAKTPQQAMDALCKAQEDVLARLETCRRAGRYRTEAQPGRRSARSGSTVPARRSRSSRTRIPSPRRSTTTR